MRAATTFGLVSLLCLASAGCRDGDDVPANGRPDGGTNRWDADIGDIVLGGGGDADRDSPTSPSEVGPGLDPLGPDTPFDEYPPAADVSRLVGTRLLWANRYLGLVVYDVGDPKLPVRLSRLPLPGTPVQMFVDGTTVSVLLRDCVAAPQVAGKLELALRRSSQLVTIDVSDVARPRVVKTIDVPGTVRDGEVHRIGNVLYVVAEMRRADAATLSLAPLPEVAPDEAWVTSFDLTAPMNPVQVDRVRIFHDYAFADAPARPDGGAPTALPFFDGLMVTIQGKTLVAVENWETTVNDLPGACGYERAQHAAVSVFDISDAAGAVKARGRFEAPGQLLDASKLVVRQDAAAGHDTFVGVFRHDLSRCAAAADGPNTLESWDVSAGAAPRRLARMVLGIRDELVDATVLDARRNLLYAMTSLESGPLYVIDLADPRAPRLQATVSGIASGSIGTFGLVGKGDFLLSIGWDRHGACRPVVAPDPTARATSTVVTFVDVRATDGIRLAQRACVVVQDPAWKSSPIVWSHGWVPQVVGAVQEGDPSLIVLHETYSLKDTPDNTLDLLWRPAVLLVPWDLAAYDGQKPAAQQVIVNGPASIVYPKTGATRSTIFKHPVTEKTTLISLGDTALSISNVADPTHPTLESTTEVTASVGAVEAFGDYLVERIDRSPNRLTETTAEFRVVRPSGDIESAAPVASFTVDAIRSSFRQGNLLVALHATGNAIGNPRANEAIIYDLVDPTHPRELSRKPGAIGGVGPDGPFCVEGLGRCDRQGLVTTVVSTAAGPVQLTNGSGWQLTFLDLRDPAAPTLGQVTLPLAGSPSVPTLVADPVEPTGFFLVRSADDASNTSGSATRWETGPGGQLAPGATVSLPERPALTWKDAGGSRIWLTRGETRSAGAKPGEERLQLLRQTGTSAAPLDSRKFVGESLGPIVVDGTRLYTTITAAPKVAAWPATPPTRLLILDVSAGKLTTLADQSTQTSWASVAGVRAGRTYLQLKDWGLVEMDLSDLTHPLTRFAPSRGIQNSYALTPDGLYAAAGHYGALPLTFE